jgi:outer membrane usher protein
LVSTDGMGDIPVLHDNRVIGVTDAQGHLLVPDLNAYQDNHIAIDGMRLPADTRIDKTSIDAVPQSQSGVLARFQLSHDDAASVILHDAKGGALPPGSRVRYVESGTQTVVGYDGLTFIEGLQKENHLEVETPAGPCTADFHYRRSTDHDVHTIGPVVCRAEQGHSP